MNYPIRRLVFAGALVRNAAYAGGVVALQEKGLFADINGFAGTSSGSIIATLCSLGYTPEEICQEVINLDFSKIPDGKWLGPFRLLFRYGWHKGQYFEERLQELIHKKTGNLLSTFADLKALGFADLKIVGTNLGKRSATIFSQDTTPDFPISRAVRISMSIPLVFASVPFQGQPHADGGVVMNYPIDVFDTADFAARDTLGFRVVPSNPAAPAPIKSIGDFVRALFVSVLHSQEVLFDGDPDELSRTVDLPDLGISGTNFNITNEEKRRLIESGKAVTHKRLQTLNLVD